MDNIITESNINVLINGKYGFENQWIISINFKADFFNFKKEIKHLDAQVKSEVFNVTLLFKKL